MIGAERRLLAERRVLMVLRGLPVAPTGGELVFWTRMSSGRLYVALDSLERTGQIRGEWDQGPEPRQRRYHLSSGLSNGTDQ